LKGPRLVMPKRKKLVPHFIHYSGLLIVSFLVLYIC
jgi:hypothetical protein